MITIIQCHKRKATDWQRLLARADIAGRTIYLPRCEHGALAGACMSASAFRDVSRSKLPPRRGDRETPALACAPPKHACHLRRASLHTRAPPANIRFVHTVRSVSAV